MKPLRPFMKPKKKLSLSLGLNTAPVMPVNYEMDLGPSELQQHVDRLIGTKQFTQARKYLADAKEVPGTDLREVLFLMGRTAFAQHDVQAAVAFMEEANAGEPFYLACVGLGELYSLLGLQKIAIDWLMKAQDLRPGASEVPRLIGECCMAEGQLEIAQTYFLQALQLNKHNYKAWQNVASCLHAQGRTLEALECAKQVLQAYHADKKNYVTRIESDAHATYLFILMAHEKRYEKLMDAFNYWASKYCDVEFDLPDMRALGKRKLRIGYVGGDFYSHAAMSIYRCLFEHADKDRFEIIVYSSTMREDHVTEQIRGYADVWRSAVHWTDQDLFDQIRKDQIDILVDLNGFTVNNRLLVFARKAAPIQITGLGFISPVGMPQMDFFFTDQAITDPWREKRTQEHPLYLPSVMHWTPPAGEHPLTPQRRAETGKVITFGCANNLYKITEQVVGVWARILKEVPHSRLMIKARQIDDTMTADKLRARFERFGVMPDRLDLVGRSGHVEHMKIMDAVDIALDPFPYQGGVTSCEALYMGCPVIALDEGTRTSISLLKGMDLHTYAPDIEGYVTSAIEVARAIRAGKFPTKAEIRQRFLESPACDTLGYVRAIEAAYAKVAEVYMDAVTSSEQIYGEALAELMAPAETDKNN